MWTCPQCGESIERQFDSCWKCSTPKGKAAASAPSASPDPENAAPKWKLAYKMFRGTLATWDSLFSEAAAFANELGPERVLSISHSEDHSDGVVTVWYWTVEGEAPLA